MSTNGKVGEEKRTKSQDPLESLFDLGEDVVHGFEAAVERALNKSQAIKEAEAKFGSSGIADIDVRHEGWLRREDPEDRKRADALKANRDRKILSAHHINDLGGFAVSGQQFVLEVADHLSHVTDELPDHLQPLGHTLTKASVQVVSGAYIESLKHNAERGFQEIDQATPSGQHRQ